MGTDCLQCVTRTPFLLEGVAGVPSLNQADGIHPTPEGHERMAETAWPVVEEALREAAGERGPVAAREDPPVGAAAEAGGEAP